MMIITAHFYATRGFLRSIADMFGVDKSTVCRIVRRVTAAIASLREKDVEFPETMEDHLAVMNTFYTNSEGYWLLRINSISGLADRDISDFHQNQ